MTLLVQCMSHTPLMDLNPPRPEVDAEARAAVAAARARVESYDPDLVLLFAPDHFNGFFHDIMPPFCIGAAAEAIGDYGTAAGPLAVDKDAALAISGELLKRDVDVSVSYRMQVDHGFSQPLDMLTGSLTRYPVVPIFINAVGVPRPTSRRTRLFGEAIGHILRERMPERRVLAIASGGLSHDPPVPSIVTAPPEIAERLINGRNPPPEVRKLREDRTVQAARDFADGSPTGGGALHPLDPEWDHMLIDIFSSGRLSQVDSFEDEWITAKGGRGGHEVRTWIAALACLAAYAPYNAELDYYRAVPEWIAGFSLMHGQA
ncbi:3-carboxyethylcatechol 2,3-dioxygenase [Enterovirga sp. CN4-39]|uniref:3-carboxyethylcatechol 2,3-dioxygenase n=1 Tax=Enterovirga sp. CN4-39 TaxID=3400910 RepID=UPI003C0ACFB1